MKMIALPTTLNTLDERHYILEHTMTLDVGSISNIINIISQLKDVAKNSDKKKELTQLMTVLTVYDEVRRLKETVEADISRL